MLLITFKYIVFALLMIVCAMLLLLVLMQRPKQEGLGAAFGAQMTDQAFGARTTDVLKKGTIIFGSLFMILCFLLSVLMLNEHHDKNKSTVLQNQPKPVMPAVTPEQPAAEQPAEAPAAEAPAAEQPAAPAEEAPAAEQPAVETPAEQPTEAPAEQPAA
ncbi:MAG: preprotein translocase subunit SecG [Akkermansiaceae bacterium]|nr:preprotein translocase subunit SecG [Akkermansiaceae bacterium]